MTKTVEAPAKKQSALKYERVLLKLSGEALAGEKGFGFDFETIARQRVK